MTPTLFIAILNHSDIERDNKNTKGFMIDEAFFISIRFDCDTMWSRLLGVFANALLGGITDAVLILTQKV
jgi:hypothetical protein